MNNKGFVFGAFLFIVLAGSLVLLIVKPVVKQEVKAPVESFPVAVATAIPN